MKTLYSKKTPSSKYRRMIIIAELNVLRKFEDKQLIDEKIVREMGKLHSLWFNGITL